MRTRRLIIRKWDVGGTVDAEDLLDGVKVTRGEGAEGVVDEGEGEVLNEAEQRKIGFVMNSVQMHSTRVIFAWIHSLISNTIIW